MSQELQDIERWINAIERWVKPY